MTTANFIDNQVLFAANLQAAFSNSVSISGDTMTGPLIVPSIVTSNPSTLDGGFTSVGSVTLTNARLTIATLNVFSTLVNAFAAANTAKTLGQSAYNSGNNTIVLAQAAFDFANTINVSGAGGTTSQQTFLTSNGIIANGTVNLTVVGNNTVILSANGANTTQVGVVQLNDTFVSSSITQAATANVGKNIFNVATGAFTQANNVNTFAGSGFNIANSALNLSQSAFSVANAALGAGKVSKAGDTMSGTLTLQGSGNSLVVANATVLNGFTSIANTLFLTGNRFHDFGDLIVDGVTTLNGLTTITGNVTVTSPTFLNFQPGSTLTIQGGANGAVTTLANSGNLFDGSFDLTGNTGVALGQRTPFSARVFLSGKSNDPNNFDPYVFITQDNVDKSGASTTSGVSSVNIQHLLGPNFTNSRRALEISLLPTAAAVNQPNTIFLTGLLMGIRSDYNLGGSSVRGPIGTLFGINPIIYANSAFLGGTIGMEIDLTATQNAPNLDSRVGINVVSGGGNYFQGARYDTAFMVSSGETSNSNNLIGFANVLRLGQSGPWPMATNSILFDVAPQITTNIDGTAVIPPISNTGFNWESIDFQDSAWKTPGVKIQKSLINVGSLNIQTSTNNSIILDVSRQKATIVSPNNTSGNYQTGDRLNDTLGGIIVLDSVTAGGHIAAAHYLPGCEAYFPGGQIAPSTLVASTGGSGNKNASFNVSWANSSNISINPSGGKILVNNIDLVPTLQSALNLAQSAFITANTAAGNSSNIILNDTVFGTFTGQAATANAVTTAFNTGAAAFTKANTTVVRAGDAMTGTLTVPNLTVNTAINTATVTANGNVVAANIVTSGVVNSAILMVQPIASNANFILRPDHSGQVITFSHTGVALINVNNTLSVGFRTILTQINTGNVKVQAGANVTINPTSGSNNQISIKFGSVSLFCYAPNTFILDGSLQ